MKIILVLIISLHICINLLAGEKSVILNPGFTIYFEGVQSEPINKAIEILQRDLVSVLGKRSPVEIVEEKVEVTNSLVIINNGSFASNPGEKLIGFERHKLYVQNNNLVLDGADEMGTIYAIYTFSEKFLGIKPLWYWASVEPTTKRKVSISNDYEFDSGVPYVKYRAWFPNDQDLFEPWREISDLNNEILYETLLRLKLNTIEVENTIDYSKKGSITDNTKIIDRYGLIITFHHHSPMNSKLRDWKIYWKMMGKEGSPEYKLSYMPELEEFWRYNVKTLIDNGIAKIIWGVNFRGDGDIPFWTTFEDAPENMKERGQVINNAVKRQVQILKEENGGTLPMTRMIFYDEMSDLLAEGILQPPKEENLIWNFVAARRDHFPNEDIRNLTIGDNVRLGYYMNLQFTSTGSHLAQAEGPWKMEKNYRYLDSKSKMPLSFSVTNAGNIREHLLTLSANAEMMWNFNTYDSNQFLLNFCREYFGEEHSVAIYDLYRKYFNAYWNQKKSDLEEFDRQYIFHDLRYKQAVKQLSEVFFDPVNHNPLKDYSWEQLSNRTFRIVPEDNGVQTQMEALIKGSLESYNKFKNVARLADSLHELLPPEKQLFYNDNLRYQARFMMHLNGALHHYCNAYLNSSIEAKVTLLKSSLYEAVKARNNLYKMAHNQFETWYAYEDIFDIDDFVNRIDETYKVAVNLIENE